MPSSLAQASWAICNQTYPHEPNGSPSWNVVAETMCPDTPKVLPVPSTGASGQVPPPHWYPTQSVCVARPPPPHTHL